jgi:peptidoglycan/xylan/chitin deacetylase (PgdA/CDA1 family)
MLSGAMDYEQAQARRAARARERRERARRRRLVALGALLAMAGVAVAIAVVATGSPRSRTTAQLVHRLAARPRSRASFRASAGTVTGKATGIPGTTPVPILMYHVIAPPPTGAPFPGLYVPVDEFAAQMQALKAAGWHAVTLDQMQAYWKRGVPLGPGRPIVISFDNGYRSQYVNALPVLEHLGWVGDENIQLAGLPPSQGGLTDAQIRGLVAAGWELDTQGISHADLVALDTGALQYQVQSARETLRRRYDVPVDWFCYPSGHYDAAVIAEVKAAGFVGSTTVVPGWASPASDPYRLPRLRVLAGTSPQSLLAQIASAQQAATPPSSYDG